MMNDRTPCQVVSFIQHLASPIQSNPIKTPFLHVRAVVGQAVHRQQQQSTRTQAAERERETRLCRVGLAGQRLLPGCSLKPSCYGELHLSQTLPFPPSRVSHAGAASMGPIESVASEGLQAGRCVLLCTAARSRGWKMQACSMHAL
jgi:hypothetical protein